MTISIPERWQYGEAGSRYPIEAGRPWQVAPNSIVGTHDLTKGMPAWMRADLIITDPPWTLGNLNTFYTKAGRQDKHAAWTPFVDALFRAIEEIGASTVCIEFGRQKAEDIRSRLRARFPVVQEWEVVYYRKNPCIFFRAGQRATPHDYTGMDELDVIDALCKHEVYETVADPCMGRGAVGRSAFKAGHRFVGTELHPRRLSCLLADIVALGGSVAPMPEGAQP